jgi:hypothetical protein
MPKIAKTSWTVGVALYAGLPIAVVMSAALLAQAYDTGWIASGETISASKLKASLDEIQTRLATIESGTKYLATTNGKKYTINAAYCGVTTATNGAISYAGKSGYPAAKSWCETICSSASAHMCTGEELLRFVSMDGMVPQSGWYSGGFYNAGRDCVGWTVTAATEYGAAWEPNPQRPSGTSCNVALGILCCD